MKITTTGIMSSPANQLDQALVQDAVQALLKYERKRQNDKPKATLIDDFSKWIILQVRLTQNQECLGDI